MKKIFTLIIAFGMFVIFPISVSTETKLKEEDIVFEFSLDDLGRFNPGYRAETQVTYSDGEASGWSYSTLKKKYPVDDTYIRVSTKALKKHTWGKEIVVFYIFTGVETVEIEPVENVVDVFPLEEYDLEHKNVKVFSKVLKTNKKKKATEEIVIFKATPESEGSLKLDIVYDEEVPYSYDYSSTIEFKNN